MNEYQSELGTIHYFYKKANEGQKNIIFLPSFGGDSTYFNFKNLIDKLDKTYGILAIDTIGYGKSIEQDMNRNIINIIKNYSVIIEYLDLDNIVIIGHSMGGIYSLFLSEAKIDSKVIILIEPPHIGIKKEIILENNNFIEQAQNIKNLIANGEVVPSDFLDSTNPKNNQKVRHLNSQILFDGFGNNSILSEAENTIEIIDESSRIISDNLLSNVFLICTDNREEEYKKSQFKNSKKIYAITGSHYLHWSNEKDILNILSKII
ncbi:MAG: alpha/beta hydrolase [Vagococcus sp.]|uniref:alpha/beta fold hydrolase n=1 Tax=Vagococcus sp. TaxID=1933889 RepID=UPI002FC98DB8